MEISYPTSQSKGPHKKVVYRPADVEFLDYQTDLGDPGQYPFTRGPYPEMYRSKLWTMRQYAGYATAQESNQRYRYLLSQGTTGLSVAFDLPTQLGLNSDHPLASGEVGRVGVAIDSLEDMERLFEGIPLADVSTSMTINATASILLAMYLVTAGRQGVDKEKLRGTVQNDILKEYIARGTYIYPPRASLRIATDMIAFCSRELPRWNPISISGYHIREAGCRAAQEIAFTLANGETYVKAATEVGLEIDDFASGLSFFFSAYNDIFVEVAKFRAARRMWARLMKERLGARNPRSWILRFHAQTAGVTLSARNPENNIVRVSLQALAAVLGGAQSLHTNAQDEALALPTEQAALLALRTQQILAHESGITQVADPLGGSWYVEKLTQDLEEEAEAYMEKIRSLGGMLQAVEQGYVQREVQEAAYQEQLRQESGEQVVVGVNRFESEESAPIEILRVEAEVEQRQVEKLKDLRRRRDSGLTRQSLEEVRRVAGSSQNLMPALIQAVQDQATVGEMADAMRDVFGEHQESVVV
ncbi:MAG: methylmalonyl-CoA mutase family protein [Acidobacteriota bacterium]